MSMNCDYMQVNQKDLAEIQGGEVATTNLHSCNGPEFVVQLHFSIIPGSSSIAGQSKDKYFYYRNEV